MASTIRNPRDPNTLSNYQNWLTRHTIANFNIDFERKFLQGNVVLQLQAVRSEERPPIVLDTSWLDTGIVKVNGIETNHELVSRFEPYGSALKILIDANTCGTDIELDVSENPNSSLPDAKGSWPLVSRSKSGLQISVPRCSG